MKDVWEMFRVIMDERKRREFDPTVALLEECLIDVEKANNKEDAHTKQRLQDLKEFFGATTSWYAQLRKWPTKAIVRFAKLGDKALKLIGLG
jgi:DNA-binding transcriptional regulator GbsR (MarR family)